MTSLTALAASTEAHGNVMLETLPFGIISLVFFTALALVTFSYRHVANRRTPRVIDKIYVVEDEAKQVGHGH